MTSFMEKLEANTVLDHRLGELRWLGTLFSNAITYQG